LEGEEELKTRSEESKKEEPVFLPYSHTKHTFFLLFASCLPETAQKPVFLRQRTERRRKTPTTRDGNSRRIYNQS